MGRDQLGEESQGETIISSEPIQMNRREHWERRAKRNDNNFVEDGKGSRGGKKMDLEILRR